MKALLQRVLGARVEVQGETVGAIDQGLLALIGVEKHDDAASAERLLHKLLNYRVFSDPAGKMNLSLSDVGGGLLLVSQFTLVADTAAACGRASPARRRRSRGVRCSSICWRRPASVIRVSPAAASAPTCRCIWSTTGR
ncbi:D-tyrosyl-tRNA(Tyr) deacylase [Pseudomonas kuykendallii]|uniref:D-tyrosyl-tRNA(Tyr) deacylase n=1 Tax=Pseudomonas kuykendallii TaxID=1007099 RepID=A0A1H2VM87_9PSED|nr:D-tyrosyl-tRNA(Tyr) deacylase [Pseudomonas kuykendallii]